ncbi:DUF6407 family protein [Anaerobacillus isosaccharinicus]|uniref:Uncharacterized protein n=1 Tax=Anaerobacillus isosaccharinicus TaxID=1532552 RepID=A0A1S2L6X0_9BACI|nr:DUF6407 family protein [Anaerobacillus isosaccharinicus]MBA5585062.1 hypothetical protein [Anaerobacillus isosaccharinicus]QOY36592.1 hypothetical protein AWH56_002620 [Anaerobacillus isosaccharinicus]
MSKSLNDFVDETIKYDFKEDDVEAMKDIVRKAVQYFNLKSREEAELIETGFIRVLHLASIIEENLLSKIIELSLKSDSHLSVEEVYEGKVIRKY